MSTFKELKKSDVNTSRSTLTSLVDLIQEDCSGSTTRKVHQVFVTGGVGPGITSSLFQTVYDQQFDLQSANPVMDMTVGLFYSGTTAQNIKNGEDASGKLLFPSTSVMMREKIDVYRQFSQILLGNATTQFTAPVGSSTASDKIDCAMFLCFKRLFARDGIKRETFAMRWYQSASADVRDDGSIGPTPNLNRTSTSGSAIYTDVGASTNRVVTFGGSVSSIVDSANTSRTVGLLFNDRGIAVFDLAKILSGSEHVSGTIDAMNGTGGFPAAGQMQIGNTGSANLNESGNARARFIPDLMTSASIDDIVDHLAMCRFQSGSATAITFQNQTNINSTLIFARLGADEFNYSSNPTYIDSDSRIVTIDEGAEDSQQSFSFITSIGLYDSNDNCLAVAKLSRPVEKNSEKDITLRIRLDYFKTNRLSLKK